MPCLQLAKTNLRVLDFDRIKDSERNHAKSLFEDPTTGLPTKLALSLVSEAATNAANAAAANALSSTGGVNGAGSKGRLMTEEEKTRIREAIKAATSIEEIKKLDRMLAEGRVPEGQTV